MKNVRFFYANGDFVPKNTLHTLSLANVVQFDVDVKLHNTCRFKKQVIAVLS